MSFNNNSNNNEKDTKNSSSNKQFTINLHTHTERCKHARGRVNEYCEQAIQHGIKILGFSDHCPFPNHEQNLTRMDWSELTEYCHDITEAKKIYPALKILSGLEIDYIPYYGTEFYRREYQERCQLDYLIGGVHFFYHEDGSPVIINRFIDQDGIACYVRQALELLNSGLIDYLNHPDLIGYCVGSWTPYLESAFAEIIQEAIRLDIPLEINANGLRKGLVDTPDGLRWQYPMFRFWNLAAKFGPKTVIGSDAHTPETIIDNCDLCRKILDEFGFIPCNEEVAQKIIQRTDSRKRNHSQTILEPRRTTDNLP